MIGFELTDDQKALRETIREAIARELSPVVDDYEARAAFPVAALRALGDLGLLGVGFPEDLGGTGGHVEVALLAEELAAVAGGVSSGIMTHCNAARMISRFGAPEQIDRYVPEALAGRSVAALAITEPEHGSDVAALETSASRDANGWTLRGEKAFVTNAPHADVFVVLATVDPALGQRGITMFLLERGSPGLHIGAPLSTLGWHTSDIATVGLDGCRIPADGVLGEPGAGFEQLAQGFVLERVILAAMGVGAARAALEDAVAYAKSRRQFGRPIAEFQVIRHQLADLATQVEAARLMTWRAAWSADHDPGDPGPAAMAKLMATETAAQVAERAVQVFGGAGFLAETRVSRIYRDVKVLTIGGGTSEIMRGIIARSMGM